MNFASVTHSPTGPVPSAPAAPVRTRPLAPGIAGQVRSSPPTRAVWGRKACADLAARAADGIAVCTAAARAPPAPQQLGRCSPGRSPRQPRSPSQGGSHANPPLAAPEPRLAELGSPETRPRASPRPSAPPARAAEPGALGTRTPTHVSGFPFTGDRDLGGFLRTGQKHFRSWRFPHTSSRRAECRPVSPS